MCGSSGFVVGQIGVIRGGIMFSVLMVQTTSLNVSKGGANCQVPKIRHQPNEILQQLQPNLLAFLRVKLWHTLSLDRTMQSSAVIRGGGDDGFVRRLRK